MKSDERHDTSTISEVGRQQRRFLVGGMIARLGRYEKGSNHDNIEKN